MRKGDAKRKDILLFINQFSKENGYPPSVREICVGVQLKSPSTVFGHLRLLAEAGELNYDEGRKRAISVRDHGAEFSGDYISVPLLGRVTAGAPILAVEETTDYVPYSSYKNRGKELFALQIVGDSMTDAGILDGDTIIVEKTPYARNGEIVVALIEDEATVKRFYKENGHFRLQPENDAYEPIIVSELLILGKVVGLIREY